MAFTCYQATRSSSAACASVDFPQGNGIQLDGANSVQIRQQRHPRDVNMASTWCTVPHYAPNAVHVANNEIDQNDWAVYSHNGHVPRRARLAMSIATMCLRKIASAIYFSDGMRTRWWRGITSSHTGVAVAAGAGGDNVFDIHVIRNYFTPAAKPGYRSEVELGYGVGFFIEGNYEEGPKGAGTDAR